MKQVYFHIGMPKTATTFLQHNCFNTMAGVHFAHGSEDSDTALYSIFEEIARSNPTFYHPAAHQDQLNSIFQKIDADKAVISNENLLGSPYFNFPNHQSCAETIKNLVPDAKILLVIRRQDSWLESSYKQCLRHGFFVSVEHFLARRNGQFIDGRFPVGSRVQIDPRQLDYGKFVKTYAGLFGCENLLVVPYELLVAEPQTFLAKVYEFIGTEGAYITHGTNRNTGYSKFAGTLARLLNRFFVSEYHTSGFIPQQPLFDFFKSRRERNTLYRVLSSLTSRLSINYFLETVVDRTFHSGGRFISPELAAIIRDINRDANRRLDKELNLGLDRFDYY